MPYKYDPCSPCCFTCEPPNFSVNGSCNPPVLSWPNLSTYEADSYTLEFSPAGQNNWTVITGLGDGDDPYEVTGLDYGLLMDYRMKSVCGSNESEYLTLTNQRAGLLDSDLCGGDDAPDSFTLFSGAANSFCSDIDGTVVLDRVCADLWEYEAGCGTVKLEYEDATTPAQLSVGSTVLYRSYSGWGYVDLSGGPAGTSGRYIFGSTGSATQPGSNADASYYVVKYTQSGITYIEFNPTPGRSFPPTALYQNSGAGYSRISGGASWPSTITEDVDTQSWDCETSDLVLIATSSPQFDSAFSYPSWITISPE